MKKFIALAILGLSAIAFVPSAEAKTAASNVAPQQVRSGYRVNRNGRVARVVTRTRRVRVGRQVYRETYQTTYRPNGRVVTRLVSRVRIR